MPINEVLVYREYIDEMEYLVKMASSVNQIDRYDGFEGLKKQIRQLKGV